MRWSPWFSTLDCTSCQIELAQYVLLCAVYVVYQNSYVLCVGRENLIFFVSQKIALFGRKKKESVVTLFPSGMNDLIETTNLDTFRGFQIWAQILPKIAILEFKVDTLFPRKGDNIWKNHLTSKLFFCNYKKSLLNLLHHLPHLGIS